MAKDFDCSVSCLAQLNRSVETRANKRPMMSDIRESGSVEQDADVILFLYREAYYDKDSEDHFLEMIVSENRNGSVGTISLQELLRTKTDRIRLPVNPYAALYKGGPWLMKSKN
ncbi:DnaB-like helicase C-terminal domain-containing protein [Heyndrickxia shackletonii]|nr:DnaB-like helicase C-terminal domain-containing protein [Heyndrickxia shackletonii]